MPVPLSNARLRIARLTIRLAGLVQGVLEGFLLGFLRHEERSELMNSQYAEPGQLAVYDPELIRPEAINAEAPLRPRLLALVTGRRLLDVCCGAGREAGLFAADGWQVTGVDAQPAMVARARERYPRLRFMEEPADRLALDEQFDVVYLSPWMYATWAGRERRVALLRRLAGHLAPGGLLALSSAYPDRQTRQPSRRQRWARLVGVLTGGYRDVQPGDNQYGRNFVHAFAPGELEAEARGAGLEIVESVDNPVEQIRFLLLRGVAGAPSAEV